MPIQENPVVLSVAGQGPPAGSPIRSFVLTNEASCPGMACQVMTLGATLTHLWVPDNQGVRRDIVLGFDDLTAYRTRHDPYFGASVGRTANRIGQGEFSLPSHPSKVYTLEKNNGPHSLHGGVTGFSHKLWEVVPSTDSAGTSITFRVVSDHLDQGFPGRLAIECTYTLAEKALEIVYTAHLILPEQGQQEGGPSQNPLTNDYDETIVSLSNHAYFNLNGVVPPTDPSSGSSHTCLDHWLHFENLDHYLDNDATSLPTGRIIALDDQPSMDFRASKPLGQDVNQVPLFEHCRGYDHFFVAQKHQQNPCTGQSDHTPSTALTPLATVFSPLTGIQLNLLTTEPGFQLYTGNFVQLDRNVVDGDPNLGGGKASRGYVPHAGFCLETSRFPDAVHHRDWLPQVLLQKGQAYYARTRYELSVLFS